MSGHAAFPSRGPGSGRPEARQGIGSALLRRGLALSLRQKLLAVILLTSFMALVVALGGMVGYTLHVYTIASASDLHTQTELLGHSLAPALTFDDPKSAQESLSLLSYRPRIRAAAVYNARGVLVATYTRAGEEKRFPKLPEADGEYDSDSGTVVFQRIVDKDEILGTVYLRADNTFRQRVASYAGIAALVAVLSMGVAVAMAALLQRVVTRPILDIAAIARDAVERRDYSRRARKISNDEVGLLVEAFNSMLDEVQRRNAEMENANRRLGGEVAERKRSEQEIVRLAAELEDRVRDRTAQLQATNSELEAFCYSVSHDLRAPLRGIDGFSAALREDFAAELPEEANRYLDIIQSSAQRMGQLIEDLLNLSRVSRDNMDRVPVDLSATARQVVQDLRQRDARREIEISVWDDMRVEADPRLIKAALENLIGNAWKFTSKAEHARIEVGALTGQEGGEATYFVRDNGAGFDMAFAPKLFRAFQRLHGEDEFPGTGIGLATVHRIVTRHGGRIWVDSKLGRGTVFYFTLGGHAAAPGTATEPPPAGG